MVVPQAGLSTLLCHWAVSQVGYSPLSLNDDKTYLPGYSWQKLYPTHEHEKIDEHPKTDVYCLRPIRSLLTSPLTESIPFMLLLGHRRPHSTVPGKTPIKGGKRWYRLERE